MAAWRDSNMFPLVVFMAALGPSTSEASEPERVTTVATIERLPLAVAPNRVVLSVDSLAMRMELTTTADARAIEQRFLAAKPQLCPIIERIGNRVILDCRTPRIEARVDPNGGKPVLEIREVRGLPMSEDGDQIWFFYHPIALRLGSACPGDTPAAKAECHFNAGRFTEAALEFRKCLQNENRRLAQLRLGDIALRTGDPATAAGWYRMAGNYGIFGRMARSRLCELGGTCLGELRKRYFDASLLPEPLRTEMLLRAARAAAYVGAVKESMTALLEAMRSSPHVCDGATRSLCRRMVLFALKFPEREGAAETLEAYLSLPSRTEGFLAIELVRAAAERSLDQGAPLFGANLLAASLPWVEAVDVDAVGDHLLRSAEMYLAAKDLARARTLFEYAEGRIGRKNMAGPRWAVITAAVGGVDAHAQRQRDESMGGTARDLAEAYTTMSRSLRLRQGQSSSKDSELP
jgi:tetratricopeptide (TPR) repeat protein